MPNRIIKESICSSEKIASLTDFEFRLWVGLLTQVDDAGRGDARPAIIKGHVFPLRERVSIKDIDAAIHGLAAKGCVTLYEVGGRPYFWFPTWKEHQRIRDCKPKYPGPDENGAILHSAADCGELPQVAADCGLNTIQYNPNPNTNPIQRDSADKPRRFLPPSVDDVRNYCIEKSYHVDPEAFVAFYESKGWMIGKNKMTDWKRAVVTWETRWREKNGHDGADSAVESQKFRGIGTDL